MILKDNFKKTILFIAVSVIIYGIIVLLMKNKILNNYQSRILILIGINIILAISLNLIIGFTGQLALGHASFMAIGAYTAAMLTIKLHLPLIITLIAGGLMAGLVGYLIGLPTLRLKGDYLAITTLGFGEIIRVIITNIDALGGARGLIGIPRKTNFTWVYFVMIATIIIIYNIIHSSLGRALISIREDEIASEAMGINTTKYKISAFVIGSFFAGIAGGLYAHYFVYLDPNSFGFLKSIDIVTYVVLGGMGSLSGGIISTAVLTLLPEALRKFADLRMVIYPLLLIIIMIFRPQGLMGTKELSLSMFKNKKVRGGKDVAPQNK